MHVKIAYNQKVVVVKSDPRHEVREIPNKVFVKFRWTIDHRTENSHREVYLEELELKGAAVNSWRLPAVKGGFEYGC